MQTNPKKIQKKTTTKRQSAKKVFSTAAKRTIKPSGKGSRSLTVTQKKGRKVTKESLRKAAKRLVTLIGKGPRNISKNL